MSTSCSRLNIVDNIPKTIIIYKYIGFEYHLYNVKSLPELTPQIIVAIKGVWVFSLIFDKNLNNKPSLDIAYKIRGIGNKPPNKLYVIIIQNYKKTMLNNC